MQIITQIVFILLSFVESLHDKTVIDLQDYSKPDYPVLSKNWHNYSAAYYAVMVGLVCFLASSYLLAIPLFLIRSTFFNLFLNLERNKPAFYLSNKGLDLIITNLLGKYAGIIQFIGGIVIIIAINFYL